MSDDKSVPGLPTVDSAAEKKDEPTALARLVASRNRLRSSMLVITHPPKPAPLFRGGLGDVGGNLLERAQSVPGLDLLVAGIRGWWRESPARAAGVVAGKASKALVTPIAQERPVATVLAAVGIGVLVALSRPWRLLLRPALIFGVLSQVALHTLRRTPIKSWLQVLGGRARSSAPARSASSPPQRRASAPAR